MPTLSDELKRLRQSNADVALILDTYAGIDRVYRESLQAMGAAGTTAGEVRNSADVVVTFAPVPLTFPRA
jgi:formylmethanofuran dehydrogenase subunit B